MTYGSIRRVRDTLVSDVGGPDLGLESAEKLGADDRADITGFAGAAGEDDCDGFAGGFIGDVVGGVGAGTSAASSAADGESWKTGELREGGHCCGESQENRICQKHIESERDEQKMKRCRWRRNKMFLKLDRESKRDG